MIGVVCIVGANQVAVPRVETTVVQVAVSKVRVQYVLRLLQGLLALLAVLEMKF